MIDHGCIIDYTMLYVGTSGFSYDDWVSPLYPAALPKRDEDSHERHDYTYRREERAEWLPRNSEVGRARENTFIFADNQWRGQPIDTIRQIKRMPD